MRPGATITAVCERDASYRDLGGCRQFADAHKIGRVVMTMHLGCSRWRPYEDRKHGVYPGVRQVAGPSVRYRTACMCCNAYHYYIERLSVGLARGAGSDSFHNPELAHRKSFRLRDVHRHTESTMAQATTKAAPSAKVAI